MSDVELYYYATCPYAQRTRMTLIEKGIPFQATLVDMAKDREWYLKISPYGKVPCVRHNDHTLYESTIINQYLEDVFPEPAFLPSDPFQKAQARIWMHYCDEYYGKASFALNLAYKKPDQWAAKIEAVLDCLRFIDQEGLRKLSDGPFWLGEKPSLLDMHYSPFMERLPAYEDIFGFSIPEECIRLKDWMTAMQDLQSYKDTAKSDADHVQQLTSFMEMLAA